MQSYRPTATKNPIHTQISHMTRKIQACILAIGLMVQANAQVNQIMANGNFDSPYPVSPTKTFLMSEPDSSLWITDGTATGTIKLSETIDANWYIGYVNGKLIFTGVTAATGKELFVSDGTVAGTGLLADVIPGPEGTFTLNNAAVLNGFLYFSVYAPEYGMELWKTDGTPVGTKLVKDILPGPDSSFDVVSRIFSTGKLILFTVETPDRGMELWKSNGTSAGTVLVKDINPGAASSNPGHFYQMDSTTTLFLATTATNGREFWKTDGSFVGTTILKDIAPGASAISNFSSYYEHNGKTYFATAADNGMTSLYVTDGTMLGTTAIKEITATGDFTFVSLDNSVSMGENFFFTAKQNSINEIWKSDGTASGTSIVKSFESSQYAQINMMPELYRDAITNELKTKPYQNNKFFFSVEILEKGRELWISDGTAANTRMVKDINAGPNDANPYFYVFKNNHIYFGANDGIHGREIWKSNGDSAGTVLVADINPGPIGSDAGFDNYSDQYFSENLDVFIADKDGDEYYELYKLENTIFTQTAPCLGSNIVLQSSVSGANYQWQINTGAGFTNITNSSPYTGTNTATLTISNAPDTLYGYQYRCKVGSNYSDTTTIKYVNKWTGAANNLWNNPANWSCAIIPTINTDIVISQGSCTLNTNGSCRSLKVAPGASFTILTGFTLQIFE
jgi:ELWxxDGT repeat protein